MSVPIDRQPDAIIDDARIAAILVENHRAFLRYLERRVGDRALPAQNPREQLPV